ncbi:MAG: ankyrin repeat domain-containing protein [Bacteroidales bacterium]|nr:ankyrin repeat domain-containing protein [Bacteroidales bacterium]
MKKRLLNHMVIYSVLFIILGCQSKNDKLILAILEDDTTLATQLIEEGAGVNTILTKNIIDKSTKRVVGNIEGDNSIEYFENVPALIIAATNNNIDIVKSLLENGADVNARFYNSNGRLFDALMVAVDNNNYEMVKLLLDHEADPNIQYFENYTALILASYRGQDEIAKILIENGADINATDFKNRSPLIWACRKNKIDLTNDSTWHESERGYENTIQLLLKNGAEVNIQCKDEGFQNYTPLMFAVFYHDVELVQLLLEQGADITLKSGWDERPVDLARSRIHDGNNKTEQEYKKIAELIETYSNQRE